MIFDFWGEFGGSLSSNFALSAIGIQKKGEQADYSCLLSPPHSATPETMFRVASISKIVTGQVAVRAARRAGLNHPFATDVSDILGYRLRHPRHPQRVITLGMLASHQAGLTDDGGYLLPPEATLEDWLSNQPVWTDTEPGTRFDYCNLGYLLLAACAEAMSGRHFGDLSAELLSELGIHGGFNWYGVADRTDRIATFRKGGGELTAQIDATVSVSGPSLPDGSEASLSHYRLGCNPTVFSPQGGLRTNLVGITRLASAVGEGRFDTRALWQPDSGETVGPQGVFESYGMGLQIYDRPRFYPRPLIGHFAEAYGFFGGAFWDQERQTAFAFGFNGEPEGVGNDFRPEELRTFELVAKMLA